MAHLIRLFAHEDPYESRQRFLPRSIIAARAPSLSSLSDRFPQPFDEIPIPHVDGRSSKCIPLQLPTITSLHALKFAAVASAARSL
jgi:hypothetical protein